MGIKVAFPNSTSISIPDLSRAPAPALLLGLMECKMQIIKYREFYIVTRKNKAVDLVNPHTERARVVKSVFAAKWRIGRAQNLANKVRGLV